MPLASGGSSGGLGFLILVVFFVAAVAIFIAMSRSMRRMRSHVDRGDFGAPRGDEPHDAGRTPPTS